MSRIITGDKDIASSVLGAGGAMTLDVCIFILSALKPDIVAHPQWPQESGQLVGKVFCKPCLPDYCVEKRDKTVPEAGK
jgi:hypothetical protein